MGYFKGNKDMKKMTEILNILLIIANIVAVCLNYQQTKRNNEITKNLALITIEVEESKINLNYLNDAVIDLQTYQEYIYRYVDRKNIDYETYANVSSNYDSTILIFNTMKTKLNHKNKYCKDLEDNLNYVINDIKGESEIIMEIYRIEKEGGSKKNPIVNTGFAPELEKAFIRYRDEEMNVIKEKIKKEY